MIQFERLTIPFKTVYNKSMASQDVLIKKGVLEKTAGVVVFDLEKYKRIEKQLEDYRRKEKLLRGLRNFESLAQWGRKFAKARKITQQAIIEND